MIIQTTIRCIIFRIMLAIIACALVVLPSPALASLGDDKTTVQADQARLKGTLRNTPASAYYTVQEIKTPAGTVVREYLSPAGAVFAVVWQGPFLPDLRQIFGSYFQHFSQSAQTQRSKRPRIRGALLIQEPGLVVQSGGHMRAYFGRAYLPQLVPSGVNIKEVQ